MPRSPRSRGTLYRHRLDFTSLWFGLVFTIVGLVAVANPAGVGRIDLGLLGAGIVIAIGVGILGSLLTTADQPTADPQPTRERSVPLPTPESVREEDRPWFELHTPLTEVEREILEAVQAEDDRITAGGSGLASGEVASADGDDSSGDPGGSPGEGTADDAAW